MKVFGIDIIKGSVRSRTIKPKYALITVDDGIVSSEEAVSLHRLIRLVHRHKPDILAVDSIQEVSRHTQDLYHFLEQLPPKTRFVSVTGGEKKTGLIQVAQRYNLTFDKFDPFAEARAIALVAYQGTGVEVLAFEQETEIVVSRNRSPGKGGWSQNRYARKIHGSVLTYAREIEDDLQRAGLNFWKKEFKAFGGVSRVLFHVRAPRKDIPISSSRGGDVQIRISGKRLDRIRYLPLSGKPQYLIVGIDPGTTIGIAALDLNGELVKLHSSRQMNMSDVIELLYNIGKPLIIATDVSPMPFSVEKIRRAFQAVAYVPRQDISVGTKYELAGKFEYANDHERDALTAAIEAFRLWRHKWSSIIRRVPPGTDLEEIKAGITRGHSLEQILVSLKQIPSITPEKKPELNIEASDERVRILDGTVKDLRALITDIQNENKELKKEIRKLKKRINSLKDESKKGLLTDSEVVKRDLIIENLKRRLRLEERNNKKLSNRLKRIKETEISSESEGTVPVRVLTDLSRDSIRVIADKAGLKTGEPVYIMSLSAWGRGSLEELKENGVSSVILSKKTGNAINNNLKNIFYELDLPFVFESDVPVQIRGEVGTCLEENLVHALEIFREAVNEYRKTESEEMLNGLMKEYLAEREREVKKHG